MKQELEDTSVRSARNMELIFKAFGVSFNWMILLRTIKAYFMKTLRNASMHSAWEGYQK